MKILHISGSLEMGGAESLIASLTYEQKKQGNEVSVLLLKKPKDQTLMNKIQANEIDVNWLTDAGSLYSPKHIWKLRPWLKKYDIIHVHLFPALYWAGFAYLITAEAAPMVYTEHSTNNRRMKNKLLNLVDRFVYKSFYKEIIACSTMVEESFRKCYPNVKHISVVNNGIDTHLCSDAIPYTKEELLNIPQDSFLITMVARFIYPKRQDMVVDAISLLPENFHACFVGGNLEDNQLQQVKELAEKKGVGNRVHFLYIRKDIPRILKTSDVVTLCSDYEGLSLSSIEGMAAGKPFIATDVNGLHGIVYGYGLCILLDDCVTFANLILNLQQDKQLYDKIARSCSMRATEFDIKVTERGYMNIYKSVKQNSSKSR